MRMAACGQTMAHLPQSMQSDGSQMGSSEASARFSQRAVSVGKAPSTGRALTGRRSPSPASSRAVMRSTKSGTVSGTTGGRPNPAVTAVGVGTAASAPRAASTAARLRSMTVGPALA